MNKLKVLELFAGVGTQAMALKRLSNDYEDFNFEVVGISEIDKNAVKSYNAIHGETVNFGDITLINAEELPDIDLVTYSFPCQDISTAGKQGGLAKGSGTRSGLLWECEKIIKTKKPKYLLMENVKNLVSKKHKPHFEKWIEVLNSYGYTSYYACLNSKNYGIPQNRERIFMVSILGEHNPYEFPKGFELDKKLKDILEPKVDDKYYVNKINQERFKNTFNPANLNKVSSDIVILGNTSPSGYNAAKVLSVNGISCTVMHGNGRGIQILDNSLDNSLNTDNNSKDCVIHIPQATKKGYIELELPGVANLSYPTSKLRRGRVQSGGSICPTLLTSNSLYYFEQDDEDNTYTMDDSNIKVRKLTEMEMWRLMGISDEDFYKAKEAGVSNTQLSRQAGNAIVVDVLYHIFKQMFI